jgi:glycosyltransferase involved in cell wall biosynthesis
MENSKKIKMLVIPDDYTGVYKFREGDPHIYIQEHYKDDFDIDIVYLKDFPNNDLPSFLSKYDLIQFHKQLDTQLKVLDVIKFLNIPTILDIDDHFILGPDHPMYLTSQKEHWSSSVVKHIENVSCVTTTTELFADKLKKYNKNIAVIPNAIDVNDPQFTTKKTMSNRLRFGLVCGSTHMNDIKMIQELDSLPSDIKNKIQIVLCGFDTNGTTTIYDKRTGRVVRRNIAPHESIWCRYEEYLTNNYKGMNPQHVSFLKQYVQKYDDPFNNDYYRRFCTRDISKYGTHYENVDVLLAPLKENDFNLVKSQLKEIEAGFTGTAIIAENFGPYTIDLVPYLEKGNIVNEDGNALLVDPSKNRKQWVKYIKYLVENPDVVTKLQTNLRNMVIGKYSLENVCKLRVELYKSLVNCK